MDVKKKGEVYGIIVFMDGHTSLSVGVELLRAGRLRRAGVDSEVLGTHIPVIRGNQGLGYIFR